MKDTLTGRATLQITFLGNLIKLSNPVLKETSARLHLWPTLESEGSWQDPCLCFDTLFSSLEQLLGLPRTRWHCSHQASTGFVNGTEAGAPKRGQLGQRILQCQNTQPEGCRHQTQIWKEESIGGGFSHLKMLFGWSALWRHSHIPRVYNHLLGIPQNSSDNETFLTGPWKCSSTIISYRLVSPRQDWGTKQRNEGKALDLSPTCCWDQREAKHQQLTLSRDRNQGKQHQQKAIFSTSAVYAAVFMFSEAA